jgi:hypothetical protein
MGLKGYKAYKRNRELLELLASYGVCESDLRYLHEALSLVKALKSRADEKPIEAKASPSKEQQKEIKERQDRFVKPEDIVQMFAGDAEEFYPNGRKQS